MSSTVEATRFTAPPTAAGKTLAAVLREAHPEISWNRARELCQTGRVSVDGDPCLDAHVRMRGGESIEVDPTARKRLRGVLDPSDVLHLDGDVVVVNKRAGVLTVPFEDGDRDTLADQVRAFLMREARRTQSENLDIDVGVVQRLDKETTGVLVFARSHGAKRALDAQIRAHSAERRYLALVHGRAESATHHTFLVQDRGDGLRGSWGTRRSHVGSPPPEAKESTTHVRVLERLVAGASALEVPRDRRTKQPLPTSCDATLVECRLESGRQHQIRIHLAESGHPLVGEKVYVRDYHGPRIAEGRPLLHAAHLAFLHPRTGRRIEFDAPLPRDFERALAALRAPSAPETTP